MLRAFRRVVTRGHLVIFGLLSALVAVLAACTQAQPASSASAAPPSQSAGAGVGSLQQLPPLGQHQPIKPTGQVREFTLTAAPARWELRPGVVSDVLAFNGTVPGPVLRVTEGDTVQITVVNKLQEPTSIHWHGLHVPNAMDGVPGLNQQPIAPGGSFAYKFIAPHAGTFMYHPHGPGVNDIAQIDQGLYGLFIINPWQPVGPAYARDYAFIILVAWCCRTA